MATTSVSSPEKQPDVTEDFIRKTRSREEVHHTKVDAPQILKASPMVNGKRKLLSKVFVIGRVLHVN